MVWWFITDIFLQNPVRGESWNTPTSPSTTFQTFVYSIIMPRTPTNSASTRVTPSKSSKKVMLRIIFVEVDTKNVGFFNFYFTFTWTSTVLIFIFFYYGCVMENRKHCNRKLKGEKKFLQFQFVLDKSGWWRGRLRGKEGLFPANYIEKIWPITKRYTMLINWMAPFLL